VGGVVRQDSRHGSPRVALGRHRDLHRDHATFNTLGFIFAVGMSTDLSAAIDRSAGDETTALGLVGPSLILIATTIVVWFRTQHTGLVTTPPVDWRPTAGNA
jgi:hypothetical protein